MNKNLVMAAIMALPLSLQAAAWRVDAGYTTVNLSAFKDEMSRFHNDLKNKDGHTLEKDGLPNGGIFASTGVDFTVAEGFSVGPELGWYDLGTHKLLTSSNNFTLGSVNRYDIERSFSLIPVLLRLGYLQCPGVGLYYGVNVGLGYGFGTMSGTVNYTVNGSTDTNYSTQYRGQGFVGDLHTRAGYEGERYRVGLGLGYRQASFAEFNSTATIANPNGGSPLIREGDSLRDAKGNVIPMDMGGIQGNLELALKF